MKKTLALVGNPNCGKTTLFNDLTGSKQYVGNWPGVTVERKGGKLKHDESFNVMDLPGVYSLSPYSPEEVITRNYLLEENPDVIINIIDGSNLERNLYLTMQLLEMGKKVVVALNMMDLIRANGDKLDLELLSQELGCPVIPISARTGEGVNELVEKAVCLAQENHSTKDPNEFSKDIEELLGEIDECVELNGDFEKRWQLIKVLERDGKLLEKLQLNEGALDKLEVLITRFEQAEDDDSVSIIATGRYQKIDTMLRNCYIKGNADYSETMSDKIDRIVLNRFLGLPIFFGIMWLVYYICIQTIGDQTIGLMEELFEGISGYAEGILETVGASEAMSSLVLDGLIGGVGAVLGFVPQIALLFLFLSFLEDCGYMSRVAFIMDRIFRQFGLSGKSFIPMLIGTGCSVPGIMAARTIENDRDRKLTIMLTPFIPCNAKLPVFALFTAAFFPENSWVGPSMYLWGMAMVIISGILLKKTSTFAGEPASFVMELPTYHMPRVKDILIHTWERAKGFIIKAGTVIFLASGLVWFLQSFNFALEMVDPQESIMAAVGQALAPLFAPLGFDTWETAFAAITGFLAKEVVVSTFGILAGIGEVTEEDPNLINTIRHMFVPASAYAFMVFTLLASPCFAAIGAIKREMGSWRWTIFALLYQTGLAYVLAMLIYQVGSRI